VTRNPTELFDSREQLSRVTHRELVQRAGRWLKNTKRCGIVLCERAYMGATEIPDAIGWSPGAYHDRMRTVLVECKATRSDFLADKKKASRAEDDCMGSERWYLMPPGIADPDEMPEGWGLLLLRKERVYRAKPAPYRKRSERALTKELRMLYAHARREELGLG
jgi:hypothetical protein